MIFKPKYCKMTEGSFTLPRVACATAHPSLQSEIFGELWHHFSLGSSELCVTPADGYCFSLGSAAPLPLNGYAYTVSIEPRGICLLAESETALIHAFMTLLDRFTAADAPEGTRIEAAACQLYDRASIGCRMVHFCVFPETELWELRRFVRFAAALKYSHLILEFWGTLRLDCLRELAWPSAFSKEEIRPILEEGAALGLETVPMFNHLGHASGSRIMHGKHVVLDQNPALGSYFSEDGWCWAIEKPRVRALLRKIRAELCELCGEGSYFHVGCDEAFGLELTEDSIVLITDFLNGIAAEMKEAGRRVIAWGDMLLFRHAHYDPANPYTCNSPSAETERAMLGRLSRDILIADWQYDARHAPIETAGTLTAAGFDCLLCPWDKGVPQLDACADTVKEEGLFGLLHTTWHTLTSGMPFVLLAAVRSFDGDSTMPHLAAYTKTAALLRRVMPAEGDYRRAGWSREQVGIRW